MLAVVWLVQAPYKAEAGGRWYCAVPEWQVCAEIYGPEYTIESAGRMCAGLADGQLMTSQKRTCQVKKSKFGGVCRRRITEWSGLDLWFNYGGKTLCGRQQKICLDQDGLWESLGCSDGYVEPVSQR